MRRSAVVQSVRAKRSAKVERNNDRRAHAVSHTDLDDFGRAVERVLRHYDNDVHAFVRDVQRDMAKRAEGAPTAVRQNAQE